MTTNTLHTPLEEFLFFRSLRTAGVSLSSFAKISDTLKENEHIHSSENYDPERLSTASLQQLYLRLLKDELRSQKQPSPGTDADPSPRRRKLSSPPLQSIDEASKHNHLLPNLVDRLYARYKEHIISAIRDDEKRYGSIWSDIQEIEQGGWDQGLQAEEASRPDPLHGSIQHRLQSETEQANALDNKEQVDGSALIQKAAEATNTQSPAGLVSNGQAAPARSPGSAALKEAQTRQQPGGIQAPYSPHPQSFQPPAQPSSQIHGQAQGFPGPPPVPDGKHKPHPSAASPRPPPGGSILPDRPSGSPEAFYSPSRPDRPSTLPPSALDSLADLSAQPYRPPLQKSPPQGQLPSLPSHPNIPPQQQNYPPRPFPYYEGQPQYLPPFSPYGQPPVPPFHSPHSAHSPAPYGIPNQPYSPNARPPPPGHHQPPATGYGAFQGFTPGQQQVSQYPGFSNTPPYSLQTTPLPNSTARRNLGLTPLNTSVSSTKWKSTPRPAKGIPRSPTPPMRSPYLPSSPDSTTSPEEDRQALGPSSTDKVGKGPEAASRIEPSRTRGRGSGRGRWAGYKARGRGAQVGSSASSAQRGSRVAGTRSPSIASHTDELSMDALPRQKIKPEPSTPLPQTDDTSAISTPGSTARPSGRRNTLRTVELQRPGLKRKRANTLEGSPDISFPHTPYLPTRPHHVMVSNNFQRVSKDHLNDISTHKLANMFAKPITERDVPGYHALIYQPQDIKTIRAAINHGSRAVAAIRAAVESSSVNGSADEATGVGATPTETGPSTTGKNGPTWVERTDDVVPPRGIVNSTQLGKEFFRMFANAVMFNPDPARGFGPSFPLKRHGQGDDHEDEAADEERHYEIDDGGAIVRDTREIAADVEKKLESWRAAERIGEGKIPDGRKDESEAEELAEEGESKGRSRRG